MKTSGRIFVGIAPLALLGWGAVRYVSHPVTHVTSTSPVPEVSSSPKAEVPDDNHEDDRSYVFRIPSGEPTSLSCEEARTIVDQVRAGLAYAPAPVPVDPFATSAADWLDPHGLLTLAKDAPASNAIAKAAPELLVDIEGRRQRGCASALGPAAVLEKWASELRDAFDRGRAKGEGDAHSAAGEPLPPTGAAREVAEEIGRRAGIFERTYGKDGTLYVDEARRRFFPPLDKNGWSKVVLASAVRAYVPLVDPHGEWAPFDEESRIYEVDLASRPPGRLWSHAVPTAVGIRLTDGTAPPFATDDVVLAVAGVATAGLPLEQVDQLAYTTIEGATQSGTNKKAGDAKAATAVVLRKGEMTTLELEKNESVTEASHESPTLAVERMQYGDGDILVVGIKDVRDDLGDDLASILATERDRGERKLAGVVLDLRGNGGGSTDGALGALSLFLPGAPLFAMRRRDGTIEIDRAPVPRDRDRWTGPVATLLDGTTASAAEMIAGALSTYKRGTSIGTTTFGKGCAQEYVDDDAHTGVLRLTTLVYALADGTPVQRVGLSPQIRFPFVVKDSDGPAEDREAKLTRAAPAWRGPDLRDPTLVPIDDAPWPAHGGTVGPCQDADVCKSLRLLGGPKRVPVAKH